MSRYGLYLKVILFVKITKHFIVASLKALQYEKVRGWGFKRITHGPVSNVYDHEMILRGTQHLFQWIK
jgi:hypothetical protein